MSGRLLSTLWKKATEAAANAVVQGLVWIATVVIVPYLSSKYGPDWLGRSLTASLCVPSWILVSCGLFAAGVAMMVWAKLRRRKREANDLMANIGVLTADIERREWQAKTFPWGGVEWPLTGNFWRMVLDTSADSLADGRGDPQSLLNGAIGDPLCGNPKCRHEVWPYVTSGRCGECSSTFQLGLARMQSVPADVRLELKRRVYSDARAEYFRRQGSPPRSDSGGAGPQPAA